MTMSSITEPSSSSSSSPPHTGRMSKIDSWLLWPKVLYFMLNFCVYSSYHFFFKYVRERYFMSDSIYGLMNSLSAISFLSSIFWTTLADRSQRHTMIMLASAVAYSVSYCLLWTGEEWFKDASQVARNIFVAICFLLTNVFVSALYPILDNRIMVLLSQQSAGNVSKDLYGRQRLWGCVGQSVVGIVSGITIKTLGFSGMFLGVLSSTALFVSCVAIFHCKYFRGLESSHDARIVLQPEKQHVEQQDPDKPAASASEKSPFWQLITHPRFLMLLFLVFVGGVARAIVGTYLQQYLERYYNVDILSFATMSATRMVTEIGAFFIAKPLIRLCGPGTLLVFGILAGMLRVGWYGFMPSNKEWAYSVPYIELLKGINAAFIVVGGTRIAHDIAPEGAEATAQGFFSGIHGNLSNSFSGLFGSIVIRYVEHDRDYALRALFKISTFMSLSSVILYSLYISLKSK